MRQLVSTLVPDPGPGQYLSPISGPVHKLFTHPNPLSTAGGKPSPTKNKPTKKAISSGGSAAAATAAPAPSVATAPNAGSTADTAAPVASAAPAAATTATIFASMGTVTVDPRRTARAAAQRTEGYRRPVVYEGALENRGGDRVKSIIVPNTQTHSQEQGVGSVGVDITIARTDPEVINGRVPGSGGYSFGRADTQRMGVPGHPVGAQALFATFAKAAADELARQSRIVADPVFYGRDTGARAGASPDGNNSPRGDDISVSGQKAEEVQDEAEGEEATRLNYQGEIVDDLSFTEEGQLPPSSSLPSTGAETGAQAQVAPVTLYGDNDAKNREAGVDIAYPGSDDEDSEEQEDEEEEEENDSDEEEEQRGGIAATAEAPRHLTTLDVSPISMNPQSPTIAPSTDGRASRALSPSMRVLHPSSRNAAFETMSPTQKRQMHLLNMIADLRNRSAAMN